MASLGCPSSRIVFAGWQWNRDGRRLSLGIACRGNDDASYGVLGLLAVRVGRYAERNQ
jgi:hypothetical protein